MNGKEAIAAFDFDGTITYRDTFIPFLWFSVPVAKFFLNIFLLAPAVSAFFLHRDRQRLKEQFIARFFGGSSLERLEKLGKAYAADRLEKLVRPEALARIQWHQGQGHRCVLVSAALEIYLRPWGGEYGFEQVICSRLEVKGGGHITGKLRGLNCRREEKVRRLEEVLGPREDYLLYAYGDSDGDLELLSGADYAFYREMPA